MTTSGNKIAVYSTNDSDVGEHTILLKANLKNYAIVQNKSYQATVKIQKCAAPILYGNAVSD